MRIPRRGVVLACISAGLCAFGQELATRDEQTTFKSRVNLVMVPVVVRDAKGRVLADLKQEDFTLFDKGKPQTISRFSVEKSGGQTIKFAEVVENTASLKPGEKTVDAEVPNRFVAYVFDDIHAKFSDLAQARDAARRHIAASLAATDRAAIFTTSGQVVLEFTDDRDQLQQTLMRLQPRPVARAGVQQCPDLSYYMSDLIVNKHDPTALTAGVADYTACGNLQNIPASTVQSMVMGAAQQVVSAGEQETRIALTVLKDVIRRMAATPGQRIVVVASPGFLTTQTSQEKMELIDRAIKANVTVNALDIRGLYVDAAFDASQRVSSAAAQRYKSQFDRESASADADVLAEISSGTGGTFFQNNNDMEQGFKRTAAAPESYYLLGFSPQNLKLDGSFHGLKVALKTGHGIDLQARRGYYAPKRLSDEAENAKAEIEEALFSREELKELPIELHTQFFKASDIDATVTVMARLDIRKFKFRKAEERNRNDVTIVSALFDRNGNMVTGITKKLEMRLKDETLEKKVDAGFTIRTSFSVKPGTYLVRLVVRDTEGQRISAANSALDIPK